MVDPALKAIGTIYLVAGVAFGALLEPWLSNKKPVRASWAAGIIVVTLVLLMLNVRMYLQARKPTAAEFAPTAGERWMKPIFATLAFLGGAVAILIATH